MSAISVMTQRQKDFINIFESKEHTKAGVYSVNFWKNGEKVNVLIDSMFPATKQNQAAFGHSAKDNELWVMILEKAYGQIYFESERASRINSITTTANRVLTLLPLPPAPAFLLLFAQPKSIATTSRSRLDSWIKPSWI